MMRVMEFRTDIERYSGPRWRDRWLWTVVHRQTDGRQISPMRMGFSLTHGSARRAVNKTIRALKETV